MNPLYQHSYVQFMESIFIGGFILLSIIVFSLYRKKSNYLLASLPLFALLSHQVEEYVISPLILGESYHFLNWAYRIGMDISPMEVVAINSPGWLIVSTLFLLKQKTKAFPKAFLLINSLFFANAAFHIGVATSQGDFSPGMITSLFMFLPLFIYAILLSRENQNSFGTIFSLILLGFVIHFILLMRITVF